MFVQTGIKYIVFALPSLSSVLRCAKQTGRGNCVCLNDALYFVVKKKKGNNVVVLSLYYLFFHTVTVRGLSARVKNIFMLC